MRTSQVNQTPYCLASHMILAKNLGWSEDQLTHLAEWPEREDFTPAEKAALSNTWMCKRLTTTHLVKSRQEGAGGLSRFWSQRKWGYPFRSGKSNSARYANRQSGEAQTFVTCGFDSRLRR